MPDDRDRDEGGKFTKSRDPSDVFDAMDPLEPYTSGELADVMDWPRRTVYEALQTLSEDGKIRKKKPEPRRAIWIKTEESDESDESEDSESTENWMKEMDGTWMDESDESESSGEDRETNQDESEESDENEDSESGLSWIKDEIDKLDE